MTIVANLHRRSSLLLASVLAAAAVFVPLAALGPISAHIDPVLAGLHGRVRVIVQTSDVSAAEAAVRRAGGKVTRQLPIAAGFAATVPSAAVDDIARLQAVRSISLDSRVHVLGQPDPSKLKSVYPRAVNADNMWSSGKTGAGVGVALVDTGIANVPDLAGRIVQVNTGLAGLQTAPCVNFSGESNCNDSYGHGTFIAGIIGGSGASSSGAYTGVAPGVKLVSVKIAGANGATDVSNVLAAIQWVVSFKDTYDIQVMNLSLGSDGTQTYRTDPFDYAVERAWQAGIVVVVSAGNAGPNPRTISKPADDPFVVTVGASDDKATPGLGDDTIPNFSARGPTAADGINKPDVVAPGGHIISLRAPGSTVDRLFPNYVDANYRKGSGTSMSAGVVSGSVALLLQAHPTWTPDRVKYALTSTANNVVGTDPNTVGAGELDVQAANSAGAGLANQGIEPGNGTGTLDGSRGTVHVSMDDPLAPALSGLMTGQLLLFSQLIYLTGSWNPITWYGGQWQGGQWHGGQWHEYDFSGGQWHGGQWHGYEDPTANYGSSTSGGQWLGAWE
jgi:serine protease AprX